MQVMPGVSLRAICDVYLVFIIGHSEHYDFCLPNQYY